MTAVATNETRLAHAREVLSNVTAPDWFEQPDAETLAKSKYAVTIARDGEEWTDGADSAADIAAIALGTVAGPEYDVEWIESIVNLDTGEVVTSKPRVVVTVVVEGEYGMAADSVAITASETSELYERLRARVVDDSDADADEALLHEVFEALGGAR